jgi:mono/diheme cytochrome c family protein
MRIRRLLRWSARLGAGLLGLVAISASAVYGITARDMSAKFDVPEHPLVVPNDSAGIARGQHVSTIRGCVDCHGENLAGRVVLDDPAIGRMAGANLTTGRRGGALTARDWERAVRHGVRRDSTPLLLMPSHEFTGISDEDLGSIAAYARSLPGVSLAPPPSRAGPVIRALSLGGGVVLLPAETIDHTKSHPGRVEAEPGPRYGAYLAAGCVGCHGPTLSGGKIPGAPPDWKPAANITPEGIGHYTEEAFITALRTGRRPDGSPIDSLMPWRLTKQMTDVELRAVYAYLRTVPPKPYGSR